MRVRSDGLTDDDMPVAHVRNTRRMRIAHVSTFPPLRCGIATFASDLIDSMPFAEHVKYSLHYGAQGVADVAEDADVRKPEQLAALAHRISDSDCDVLCLQHEFGIWGGAEGENIHPFLDNLTKPIITVLHTTFGTGVRSTLQGDIVRRLVRDSARVIVLTDLAKVTLEGLIGRRADNVVVIPHGVPDTTYLAPSSDWSIAGELSNRPLRLITPGYFRPDKGFETILLAVRRLVRQGRHVTYLIAGEPQRQFAGQDDYRADIEELVLNLGLGDNVRIDARYLTLAEQIEAIQDSHMGIFGYQDPTHASSGTIPLVLSVGRPVICTPFEYAIAKQKEVRGVMVASNFGALAIAERIAKCIEDRAAYVELAKACYDQTREWCWHSVGLAYSRECALALHWGGVSDLAHVATVTR